MKQLFNTALDFINNYDVNAYVIKFEPRISFGKVIKLQGKAESNTKLLESFEFVFDVENSWYTYNTENIDITLTKD